MTDQQPLISHLVELRNRLLKSVIAILLFAGVLLFWSNDIYQFVAAPLLDYLPENATMIATQVASPFLTPFKLTLSVAILLAMPVLLYQVWGFIAPGLYDKERKIAMPLLISSALLFFLGMIFAYYAVFPLMFQFFIGATPEGVTMMTDISHYLDFVLKLFFAFGLAFEVPVATVLLVHTGISTVDSLKEKRPYVIVGAFVMGMLLTPPDVISQTLLAVPVWLLFELGLFCSRWWEAKADSPDTSSN